MKPDTLFDLATEHVDVWVWCTACHHQAVLQTAVLMTRLGSAFPVQRVADKCRCSSCGSKNVQARPEWSSPRSRSYGHHPQRHPVPA